MLALPPPTPKGFIVTTDIRLLTIPIQVFLYDPKVAGAGTAGRVEGARVFSFALML